MRTGESQAKPYALHVLAQPVLSQSTLELQADFAAAESLGISRERDALLVRAMHAPRNLWLVLARDGVDVASLRVGVHAGPVGHIQSWTRPDGTFGFEFQTPLGAMRAHLQFCGRATVHVRTSLIPHETSLLTSIPRDMLMLSEGGEIFTKQRGLRSGIVFGRTAGEAKRSVFYFQNFSALSGLFDALKATPADTVGGQWPELGFSVPTGSDSSIPGGTEVATSDTFITLSDEAPANEDDIARLYLDLLADTYLELERPPTTYRPWNVKAAHALRDLSLSPACTYERQRQRFLMPYVADPNKPPESMVQFTVSVNVGEYDRWRNEKSQLAPALRKTAASFFNKEIGCVVRWLPGEHFDPQQAEENMNHQAMDSWYLHHSLFNVFRFADEGDPVAKRLFERSLPFLIRVARRFNYQWPIFFDLFTLDIIRAESSPGKGGERDVAGMYALVMIHAYEMFGDVEYFDEAQAAIAKLFGFGFELAYQLNTTGFAAEAALRLWKMTKKKQYLGLAEVCLANIFDNMWLWQCTYGFAAHYSTFFGLFPLRDAPYIAPYEELEAHAKFHEYLQLGGKDVRPSLRLLIGEFQKYSLHRCWFYYPDSLPGGSIAEKPRNGSIERSLAIPLEDLQDGREQSGQVGQEIYGAGLPFVLTARHYMYLARGEVMAYCDYPMFEYAEGPSGTATWRVGGDDRCSAEIRLFMTDPKHSPRAVSVWLRKKGRAVAVNGSISVEGHAVFTVRGGQSLELRCAKPSAAQTDKAVIIGPLAAMTT